MGAAVDDRLGHPRTGVPTFFDGTYWATLAGDS